MSSRYADGVYDKNAPGLAGYAAVAVGASSNEERMVGEALRTQSVADRDVLRAYRPRGAQVLYPARFVGERTQPGINEVVDVDRRYPDSSAQFSGRSGSYSGSSTPSLGWW